MGEIANIEEEPVLVALQEMEMRADIGSLPIEIGQQVCKAAQELTRKRCRVLKKAAHKSFARVKSEVKASGKLLENKLDAVIKAALKKDKADDVKRDAQAVKDKKRKLDNLKALVKASVWKPLRKAAHLDKKVMKAALKAKKAAAVLPKKPTKKALADQHKAAKKAAVKAAVHAAKKEKKADPKAAAPKAAAKKAAPKANPEQKAQVKAALKPQPKKKPEAQKAAEKKAAAKKEEKKAEEKKAVKGAEA